MSDDNNDMSDDNTTLIIAIVVISGVVIIGTITGVTLYRKNRRNEDGQEGGASGGNGKNSYYKNKPKEQVEHRQKELAYLKQTQQAAMAKKGAYVNKYRQMTETKDLEDAYEDLKEKIE